MLSSLPKIFDKNFVVGFLLPALLAIVAAAWAFPSLGIFDPIRSLSNSQTLFGDLTYSALLAFVLAIFLMTANDTLYKILEGYFPPVSWFLPLRWWHRSRFRAKQKNFKKLRCAWLTAITENEEFPEKSKQKYEALRSSLVFYYPNLEGEVMTTRFGNIIRSMEVYPREVHGVDSVHVWTRLASVIPKEYTSIIDDARAQTDCFVNLTILSTVFSIIALIAVCLTSDWHPIPAWSALTVGSLANLFEHSGPRHVATAALGVVVGIIAYWRACVSAVAWGDWVRSAFDCFLPALINQLGYALPPTMAERKKFWTEFSILIAFQEPMEDNWPIAKAPGESVELPEAKDEKSGNNEERVQAGGSYAQQTAFVGSGVRPLQAAQSTSNPSPKTG
jgi:hypothetical protein